MHKTQYRSISIYYSPNLRNIFVSYCSCIFFSLAHVLGQILSGLVLGQLSPPNYLEMNVTDIAEFNGCSQLQCGSRMVLDGATNATDVPLADIQFNNDVCQVSYFLENEMQVICVIFAHFASQIYNN